MTRGFSGVSGALRLTLKEIVWLAVRERTERPTTPDICLHSSRRGGSTLLMEALASNRGVSFSDQPFSLFTASRSTINRLPIFDGGQVISLEADEALLVQSYLADLLDGRVQANAPWKLAGRLDQLRPQRMVLKITDAKAIADWIHDQFFVDTVLLFRHPIAQATSVARNGWLTTGRSFLRNSTFRERYLDPDLESYCWAVYRDGEDLQQRIVDWCLENLPLLHMLKSRPEWIALTHEQVLLEPDLVSVALASRLSLPDSDAVLEVLKRPSRSTKRSSTSRGKQMLRRGQRDRFLQESIDSVSAQERSMAQSAFDRFGIALYDARSPMPDLTALGDAGLLSEHRPH